MNKALTILYIILWIVVFSYASHGSVSLKQPQAETRVQQLWPDMVLLHGSIIDGQILGTSEDMYTLVRVQPYHAPLLFDVSYLFCGYQGEEFRGMTGPIEISFDPVAHRLFQGVACFDLIKVDHWAPPKMEGW